MSILGHPLGCAPNSVDVNTGDLQSGFSQNHALSYSQRVPSSPFPLHVISSTFITSIHATHISRSTAYEGSDDAYYAYFALKAGPNFVNGNADETFSLPEGDSIAAVLAQPIQANTVALTSCNIIDSNTIRLTVRVLADGTPYEGSGIGFINYVLCVKKS